MAVSPPDARSPAVSSFRGSAGRRRKERAVRIVFLAAALTSVAISAFIIWSLAFQAIDFLRAIDIGQLRTDGWFPRRDMYDIATLVAGSLIVTVIAVVFATFVGLGAAIYLAEYASPRVRGAVKPVLEILAGIPSVVLGFFALTWINPNIVQQLFRGASGFNFMAAGLGVGILIIPLIASISEDAMRAVPRSLREASYGLGARRITTSVRVVLPASISGIVAALTGALLDLGGNLEETRAALLRGSFATAAIQRSSARIASSA